MRVDPLDTGSDEDCERHRPAEHRPTELSPAEHSPAHHSRVAAKSWKIPGFSGDITGYDAMLRIPCVESSALLVSTDDTFPGQEADHKLDQDGTTFLDTSSCATLPMGLAGSIVHDRRNEESSQDSRSERDMWRSRNRVGSSSRHGTTKHDATEHDTTERDTTERSTTSGSTTR